MTVGYAGQLPPPGPVQGFRAEHTALTLIFGPGEDISGAVAGHLNSVLDSVPEQIRRSAVDEVTSAVRGLLDVNLIDMVIAGWRKHQELTAAARRTLLAPGSAELVRLANHQITVTEQPYINVVVNGVKIARLDLKLSLTFDVSALIAVIGHGSVTALRSGRCEITATLVIQDANVFSGSEQLDLPGAISLRQGIRLLPASEYPQETGITEEIPPAPMAAT